MNKPTQEQIKEFWEWCGFKYHKNYKGASVNVWEAPDGLFYTKGTPPIDLNNLFKYAVPKLPTTCDMYLSVHWEKPRIYTCTIQDIHIKGFKPIFITDADPALALFWALWQVKEESK